MIARADAARLTRFTTGRDNRSLQGHYRKLLPLRAQHPMRQQCQGPRDVNPLRALVILHR